MTAVLEQPVLPADDRPAASTGLPVFSYDEAFSRHEGLLTREEQEKLRDSRVAIIGMGGVGGVHLMTLTRMGIGKFTIADPDTFELANFNRQYGANMRTVGRKKVDVMAEQALAVNPELDIRAIEAPISEANVDEFLDGADVLVDGVDFFAVDARRLVFREARARGLWAVTAGPYAFGSAWMVFDPQGMSFEEFFGFHDRMDEADKIVAFAVGGVPRPIHLSYIDLRKFFDPKAGKGGSVGAGCHIASGIIGAEIARIRLFPDDVRAAPWYFQFDAYRQKLVSGRLWWGNRHPWQRIKRFWLRRQFERKSPTVDSSAQ